MTTIPLPDVGHTRPAPLGPRPATGYRLGRLPFTLAGTGECADYLRGELEPVLDERAADDPRVSFDFVETLPPMASSWVRAAPLFVRDGGYRVQYNGLAYDVSADAPRLRVQVGPPMPGWRRRMAPEWLLRACDWNFLSTGEIHAKNFMYGVFDHITQVAQLPLGQSYIHASSFEKEGEGVALLAWGGIGKTSAALKLVTEHGYRFLSDDLGLIDEEGMLWRTPKRLQVYAYNLLGQDRLRAMLMQGRTTVDRASWVWWLRRHGANGVRRRVSAESLFGPERVAIGAPLTRLICLERGNASAFEARPISAREASDRATPVVMHEIEPFSLFSRAMHGGGNGTALPTPEEVARGTREVLERAFGGVPAWVVRIPQAASPDDLASFLLSLLDGRRRPST
ncbi:MAG TPA: hypothetical protein VF041_10540 [Gemmatimonadaceae bacterium]